MTDLTISISAELMEKLRPYLAELPRWLERGMEVVEQETTTQPLTKRQRIIQLLSDQGIAKPLDKNLVPPQAFTRPRQKPLAISGKPVSEIIIEQRGPR